MIRRAALPSAGLVLAALGSAQAHNISLPVGNWGYSSNHGVECKRRILTIEKTRIVQRIDAGSARCAIKKIEKRGKVLVVDTKCVWDTSVPQGLRERPDEENPDSFSIVIKSPNKIFFNNSDYELCASVEGARQ